VDLQQQLRSRGGSGDSETAHFEPGVETCDEADLAARHRPRQGDVGEPAHQLGAKLGGGQLVAIGGPVHGR